VRKYVAFAKLPEWERAIGARVRAERVRYRLSQAKLAASIGLTRDQLNNVELGRVALRFRAGWSLCLDLDLNPAWLLLGEGDRYGFVGLSGMEDTPSDELFSNVMEDLMSEDHDSFGGWPGYVKYRQDQLRSQLGREAGSEKELAAKFATLADWLKHVSPELHSDFWRTIYKSARDFSQMQSSKRKQYLTKQAAFGKVGAMKLQKVSFWPELRERIRTLVRRRGMKAALARDIGVSRQTINALLSKQRPYGPSAEISLRLFKWVDIAESQQKQSAGSAVTRPTPKTRQRKARSNAKRKSSQNKD
jgi:transcriptional regulator with XRE-family HTH domain